MALMTTLSGSALMKSAETAFGQDNKVSWIRLQRCEMEKKRIETQTSAFPERLRKNTVCNGVYGKIQRQEIGKSHEK